MDLEAEFSGLPLSEVAYYLRLGLQLEVVTLADVSEWVDAVLLREEAPNGFFVELYRLLRLRQPDVSAYLAAAFPPARFSARPALAWLQQRLAGGNWPLGRISRALYRLRTLVESEVEVGWIYGLAADYERAASGPAEALQEVYRETEAFLACYHDYTLANRAEWLYLDAVLPQRWAGLR
ncbi:hypothetical protein K3G63_01775 [Hymenobacter sp. HSC-4F20]|uniref:hypothetical protein n=1 Tax=Hymenobacter sp. HSC-4F20 TaxID=2864135 RepID=UPI001C72A144|nr:hypothetical protein [Hymenobacter sp. HSC-4F20]MBX0289145.1 hypothetical protein [Hymenobacter sp. HSC-4F20]